MNGVRKIVIFNASKQVVLARKIYHAHTFYRRFLGWMGRQAIDEEEALILSPCRAVHTCFLKFPLDVVFVAADGRVLLTLTALQPFRFSPYVRHSRMVIELPAGRLERTGTGPGDRLVFAEKEEMHA